MNITMKNILITVMIVFLAGCASTGYFQKSLQNNDGELIYLHDSVKIAEKQSGALYIGSFVVDDVLPVSTTVTKKDGYTVPLLFVNFWKYDYESSLGYEQIKNDYKKFIQESFIEELKRSGKFTYVADMSDMEIDVEIKTLTMSAPIHQNGMFLFMLVAVSYNQNTLAGPVDVVVIADAVVKKNGKKVLSKEFRGKHRTAVLSANYKSQSKLLKDYTTAMIECTSLAIKDLNENIVNEINQI